MIKLENKIININKFPDGTLLLKEDVPVNFEGHRTASIEWLFESNEELVALIYLAKHLRAHGISALHLKMPYIPNARQDRVKNTEDVFTLKYFAEILNDLNFRSVTVLDPHSSVSEALLHNLVVKSPKNLVDKVISSIGSENLTMFYPDEGACKRYSFMFSLPYAFGIKKRDWESGKIDGLDVSGMTDLISGKNILIVDDISSYGGTFYHSAKKLKELGADKIYLYFSHCENSILDGEALKSGLLEKVFTTNSIFTKEDERIEVMNYEA
ncbi:ribose-phosphate diphosphokinase [Konateibacter massiliensis]|uniref:ribose-phosphate pyrophosphokinase n=1 Tax=Konateibacter massiliensis TaxID=2002841 RepID=UPI000C15303D|nr:ribose-phosphate pyrophosphokinase [Konateibacter massiliensis]